MQSKYDRTFPSAPSAQIRLTANPRKVLLVLTCAALGLVAADALTVKGASVWGQEIARLFDLNEEANIPTWFSSSLWLLAAFVALAIFQTHRDRGFPNGGFWLGMVPLFLFLSTDEAAELHELVGRLLGQPLEESAVLKFTYAWVFFGLGLLLLVGLLYLRFLFRLERHIRVLIVLSALVFVTGAVAVESVGAAVDMGTLANFPLGQSWRRMIILEELLEMMGVILLVHTLLRVIALDHAPYTAAASHKMRLSGPEGAGS
jgi:hypothetical protein